MTQDEEASGVIDATALLGPGWCLLDTQAHYNIGDAKLVELLGACLHHRHVGLRSHDDSNKWLHCHVSLLWLVVCDAGVPQITSITTISPIADKQREGLSCDGII